MSYKLKISHDMEPSFQSVAAEQVEKALKEIESEEFSTDAKVHQLRKRFKKIRALLRLFRKSFPDYKKENKFFRDLGRRLAKIRDAETRIESVSLLQEDIKIKVFRNVQDSMVDKKLDEILEFQKEENDFSAIQKELKTSLSRIKGWQLKKKGFSSINGGFLKTYSRARKNHKKVDSEGGAHRFHEWQKRAKYYRYQLKLLRNLWPKAINFERKAWHKLTDFLGEDHDLHILAGSLKKSNDLKKRGKILVMKLIEQKHQSYRKETYHLGNYLVAQTPEEKVEIMKNYWKAHLKLQDSPSLVEEVLQAPCSHQSLDEKPTYLS